MQTPLRPYNVATSRVAICRKSVRWLSLAALLAGACSGGEPSAGLGPVPTGSLAVGIDGLPSGVSAAVAVTGGQGYQKNLTAGQTLSGLIPGTYAVAATEIVNDGDRYSPAPVSQNVAVTSGGAPASVGVAYQLVTGRLSVTISGVPAGTDASVLVTGPGDYAQLLTASGVLTGLAPASYTVQSPGIIVNGNHYDAPLTQQEVVVAAIPGTTAQVGVSYAVSSGVLQVVVGGLPAGGNAAITVTGPGGFFATVPAGVTLTGLVPGNYSISAGNVSVGASIYIPAVSEQSAAVPPSLDPVVRTVTYSQATGSLALTIAGLPGGVLGSVTVSGPGGFNQNFSSSQTITSLIPGGYTVSGFSVSSGGIGYAPTPSIQNVTIGISSSASATVTYTASTASLQVTVSGLPAGTAPNVTVTGPGGFSQQVTASLTLTGLVPGTYATTAVAVSSGGTTYVPFPASQNNILGAGASVAITVAYGSSNGALAVTVGGLPGGTAASVTVTGPGGFNQSLTGSQTLSGLAPGSYNIAAVAVVSGGTTYNPAPPSQSALVSAGITTAASVFYSAGGGGASLNLTVNGVYLTQAIQRYDGSVPLVAGRNAYLRVFAKANEANSAQPPVRVRLYNGITLVQTYTITAPTGSVPTVMDEGTLTGSWNVPVPGTLVQPNLRVLADVDPSLATAESNESDNQFPLSGTPAIVDVRALPTFNLRFVPVLQQVNGLQGNVSDANKESFLGELKRMLPVADYDADVRAPYTTTAPALLNDNSNSAWGTVLSEVLALRSADANSRYYYGVVKTTYGSGVAGMGYVGGSARTALGWDHLPSGNGVMAHEVGHNMGRLHAPCGGVSGADPGFPHAGGRIGVWGLDVNTLALKSPATFVDLMSYCSPAWVSDYNWAAMVAYREAGPNNAPPAAYGGAGAGLLVWGRITDAGVVLEPSFRVSASGRAPTPGRNRLELLGADGSLLRAVSFGADSVADLPGGAEAHFAFVIPLDAALDRGLAGVRVRAVGRTTSRLASAASLDPSPVVTRPNTGQIDVRWDVARYPMVMVRDAATGEIISFARGGAARLWTRGGSFDLQFSDGVKSVVRQRLVPQ